MTDKVVSINGGPAPLEPRQDLIQLLEDLLAEAKSGQMREIVAVTSYSDGCVGTATGGSHENVMSVYGELTNIWLQYREDHIE